MDKYQIGELSFRKGDRIYTLDLDSVKKQFEAFLNGDSSVFAKKNEQNTFLKSQKITENNDGNISSTTYGSKSLKADNSFKIDSEYLERSDIKENCSDNEIAVVGQVRKLDTEIQETNKIVDTLFNSAKFVENIPESPDKNSIYVVLK